MQIAPPPQPARDDARPLHVQAQGARIGVRAERLRIARTDGTHEECRLLDVSEVCLYGNVQITTQAARALVDAGIPILYHSFGGYFLGATHGLHHKNIGLRMDQHRAADEPARALAIAQRMVAAKIRNQRTFLRRNHPDLPSGVTDELKASADDAERARDLAQLLGFEGSAARLYFAHFNGLIKPNADCIEFAFEGRNRRPPRDPVNALLSFAYSLLCRDLMVRLLAVGLEPLLGFLHQPRHGKPALALDLCEEFRPIIADSVVVSAINNGVVKTGDFLRRGVGIALKDGARRRFIQAYERRVDTLVHHPALGYSLSYRRVFEVQARLLGRHLQGELSDYTPFQVR